MNAEFEWWKDVNTIRITVPKNIEEEVAQLCDRCIVGGQDSIFASTFYPPDDTDGCKYCMNHEVLAWDLCGDGIVLEDDGKLHMMSGGDWDAEIHYCPMCGRKL